MSNEVSRKRKRLLWNKIRPLFLAGLVCLAVYQNVCLEHLRTENANLTYQYLCSQQDLMKCTEELKQLQTEINSNLKNELQTSRGAKRQATPLTKEEFDLVCRIIVAESGAQTAKGQAIIAQCIHDRLVSNCYGKNVTEVVMAPGQFASPYRGDLDKFPGAVYAAYSVFTLGEMPLDADVRVFFNPATADPGAIKPLREKYEYLTTEGSHEVRGHLNVKPVN